MATMGELASELLHYIILLLVQSPCGAADFARIISVCQKFRLFTQDKDILKSVNFDIKLELKDFKRYLHINSLLVKCSEAGNVTAQFLLGKVVLVSSSQLFLSEWQKAECYVHPCDFETLSDVSCILGTNVSAQNREEVDAFMTYFLPKQASSSKLSQTRLVHHQLVKVFLLNGSPYDFIEMVVFLKCYIKYFARFCGADSVLIGFIRIVVSHARHVRAMEQLAKTKELFTDPSMDLTDFMEKPLKYLNFSSASSKKHFDEVADEVIFLLSRHIKRCDTAGMNWRTAMNDMDFLEELRNDMSNLLDEAYSDFNRFRAKTLDCFDRVYT